MYPSLLKKYDISSVYKALAIVGLIMAKATMHLWGILEAYV